jgi:histidinol-phosphate aminotransferase
MIEDLIRAHFRSFKPYTSARSEVAQAGLFLDANELALGSPVTLDGMSLNRYPDPFQVELRSRLAATLGLSPESVFVGAGSDEIIDLLIRLLCEPSKDTVAVLEPTYGVYRVAAEVSNIRVVAIELDDNFQLNVPVVLNALPDTTKLLFLCSPNNPTGNLLKREDILSLCEKTRAVVVVDQAYVEFAEPAGNVADVVSRHPNLVVLRTMSKAWGLAGIRLGYCIGDPTIVSYLLRIKSPYNISVSTSRLAIESLDKADFLMRSIEIVKSERRRVTKELSSLQMISHVYPSEANFLLAQFVQAESVYRFLLGKGIIVRRRSEPRLHNCLRITVGSPGDNDTLLKALKEYS